MPRFNMPIRVKVLLTVLVLIMIVMSLNTSTMANLFRKDKTTYIRDLTTVMAVHVAEEVDALLRNYAANMRVFADAIYDEKIDPETKQDVIQNLFRNYQDIVTITARRREGSPVTAVDTSALTRLDISRSELLAYRADHPVPPLAEMMDLRMEHIKDGVSLLRMTIDIEATNGQAPFTLIASIEPGRLRAVTERTRGFKSAIIDRQGKLIFADSAGSELSSSGAEILKQSTSATAGGAFEYVADGVPMIGAYAPVARGLLLATVEIPSDVVYLTARELLSNLMIAALLLFAFAATASLVFARRLTRPLELLTNAAQKVGKGDFEVAVGSDSADEIGDLSNSFNQMTAELREREMKLASANAALVQSEKLAAFGQLGAGIAHEVKNPLAGILGYAQLTLRKLDEDSPFRKNLDIIEKETRRCTEIISNLLKFARQETATAEPTDVNDVVEAALAIVDHQLGVNDVKIVKDLAVDLPRIEANANQLQQVFLNFAINAQQAMGDAGGTLTVRTRQADNGQVTVEVEDDGPGIPQELKDKVFEPFFTTKPAGQGTGLGLSVTYGIVRDHGGDIRIEDVAGGGTRFVVSLPVAAAQAA